MIWQVMSIWRCYLDRLHLSYQIYIEERRYKYRKFIEYVNLNDIWMSAVVNHCQFGSHIKILKKVFMKIFDVSKVFLEWSNHGGQSN